MSKDGPALDVLARYDHMLSEERKKLQHTASVITGFQGLVSHFNVDSRVGWLNYVLSGTRKQYCCQVQSAPGLA